ncbi:hypothetical protein IFM89_036296 [Coptis chinensis]|uniref:Uncharacterized protein n=1 Tax=Coptis chinensis TaxID=261450 RepID=A0A835IEC1_9MAGN|nr:hypothetical protein IFM89_036296 [Coptis chinensis]
MMEVPQLHGFGPAANRLLEAYKMLLKTVSQSSNSELLTSFIREFRALDLERDHFPFLWTLRNIWDSHAAVSAGSSESTKDKSSSITKIITECESVLTYLNRDLSILSTFVARERG